MFHFRDIRENIREAFCLCVPLPARAPCTDSPYKSRSSPVDSKIVYNIFYFRIKEMLIDPATLRPGANMNYKSMVDPLTGLSRFYELDEDGNIVFVDNYSFN